MTSKNAAPSVSEERGAVLRRPHKGPRRSASTAWRSIKSSPACSPPASASPRLPDSQTWVSALCSAGLPVASSRNRSIACSRASSTPTVHISRKRYRDGCRNFTLLWRDLKEFGFMGQSTTVHSWLWHRFGSPEKAKATSLVMRSTPIGHQPIAWLMRKADPLRNRYPKAPLACPSRGC